jgi:DNA polymerase II small subunit
MDKREILKFCIERGILLDKEFLNLFDEQTDSETIKILIQQIKEITHEKIINKNLFSLVKEDFFEKLSYSLKIKNSEKIINSLKINLNFSSNSSTILNNHNLPLQEEVETKKEDKKEESNPNSNQSSQYEDLKLSFYYPKSNKKLEVSNFVNYFRERVLELKEILQENSQLKNLISINKISFNKQGFSIIGIIYSKTITKNKNIIFEVEDLTGKIKVLISPSNPDLYKLAEEITLDSVIGFSGFGNKEILFVNNLFFPDSFLAERKKSDKEEYALFIGDIHYGSKLFLEKSFLKFIDYLNNKLSNTPEVPKIKYLFIVGDLVAGVGNYPSQEKDLKIKDIESQFNGLSNLLSKIRKDIRIIISPGNHDGVRLMEPQPPLNEKYSWSLYNLENTILTGNPSFVNIGQSPKFSGFNVLLYHGFSFPYYANVIPSLIQQDSLNSPTKIMSYLLKNRHLAPTHSSVQYFPSQEDFLVIKKIPDIFISGHTHKCEISYYNNILLISVSSWESKTSYQEKLGNNPDFCKVPLFNLKTRSIKILDFEEESEHQELKSNTV